MPIFYFMHKSGKLIKEIKTKSTKIKMKNLKLKIYLKIYFFLIEA